MNILFASILVLVVIIALLLFIGLFIRRDHQVNACIIINAPAEKVFDYLKQLKNQDEWNKNEKEDPNKKVEHKGTDGTTGFIIAFSGNENVGVGEKEIKNIVDGKRVETEMRFVKPMKFTATLVIEIENISENKTKVLLSHFGNMEYPKNIFNLLFEKLFAKQMNISMFNLKTELEK